MKLAGTTVYLSKHIKVDITIAGLETGRPSNSMRDFNVLILYLFIKNVRTSR